MFEKSFLEFADTDGAVERLIKVDENYHDFATLRYIRKDGLLSCYYPDFMVKFAEDIFLVETKAEHSFEFAPNYPVNIKYDGSKRFNKHYYPFVGQMNNEEADFAQFLDAMPEVKYWVRNIERSAHSFSLPTSTDRFYPDFVAMLNDGPLLAVEYKGEHLVSADDAKEKENIGKLWADKSNGTCLFAMATKSNYQTTLPEIVKI